MKKNLISALIIILTLTLFYSCKEDNVTSSSSSSSSSSSTTTNSNAGKSFTLIYDGVTYKGSSINLITNPEVGNTKYKNILTATGDVFSIAVFNIPESGSASLNGSTYNASNGDIALTMTMLSDYKMIGGFSGTINRNTTKKITLNTSYSGKALTGTIEW